MGKHCSNATTTTTNENLLQVNYLHLSPVSMSCLLGAGGPLRIDSPLGDEDNIFNGWFSDDSFTNRLRNKI